MDSWLVVIAVVCVVVAFGRLTVRSSGRPAERIVLMTWAFQQLVALRIPLRLRSRRRA